MENQFNATPEQLADIGLKALIWRQLDQERIRLMRNQYASPEKRAIYLDVSEKTEAARKALNAATGEILGAGI